MALNLPEGAPLKVLLEYVSQEFHLNILYDEQVAGQRVTIRAPARLPKSAVLSLLESVLRTKGLALVDADQPGWKRVVPLAQAAKAARRSRRAGRQAGGRGHAGHQAPVLRPDAARHAGQAVPDDARREQLRAGRAGATGRDGLRREHRPDRRDGPLDRQADAGSVDRVLHRQARRPGAGHAAARTTPQSQAPHPGRRRAPGGRHRDGVRRPHQPGRRDRPEGPDGRRPRGRQVAGRVGHHRAEPHPLLQAGQHDGRRGAGDDPVTGGGSGRCARGIIRRRGPDERADARHAAPVGPRDTRRAFRRAAGRAAGRYGAHTRDGRGSLPARNRG